MARVTFAAEGLSTLGELHHWLDHAVEAGFPLSSSMESPPSGIAGARVAVTADLRVLPLVEGEA